MPHPATSSSPAGGTTQGSGRCPSHSRISRPPASPFLVVANGHNASVSSDGTLAYVRGSISAIPESQLVWVDRSGVEISPIGQPRTLRPILDLSPDDTRLVIETSEDDQVDLWIHDLERGNSNTSYVRGRDSAGVVA